MVKGLGRGIEFDEERAFLVCWRNGCSEVEFSGKGTASGTESFAERTGWLDPVEPGRECILEAG